MQHKKARLLKVGALDLGPMPIGSRDETRAAHLRNRALSNTPGAHVAENAALVVVSYSVLSSLNATMRYVTSTTCISAQNEHC